MPWLTAWLIYQGDVAQTAINLSGLFVNSIIDFTMPIVLTLVSLGVPLAARPILDHVRGARRLALVDESAIAPVPAWLGGDARLAHVSAAILVMLFPPLIASIVISFAG